jgi:hypothetical protein
MICHCHAEAGECCVAYRVFLWVYCGSILLLFALAFVLVPSTGPLRGLAVAIQPLGEAGTSGATLPPSLNAPSALFVPHHGGNLSSAIDGISLRADAQSKASQVSRYLRMTLADLPPPVGQRSRAQLRLHIENDQSGFGIGPVFVGPRAVIRGIAAFHQSGAGAHSDSACLWIGGVLLSDLLFIDPTALFLFSAVHGLQHFV